MGGTIQFMIVDQPSATMNINNKVDPGYGQLGSCGPTWFDLPIHTGEPSVIGSVLPNSARRLPLLKAVLSPIADDSINRLDRWPF